jgi:hypothetical protein
MQAALWYAATRLLGLALLAWPEIVVLADATKWLIDLDKLGPLAALPEYPWPTALLAYLPMYLGVPTIIHYYLAIVLANLAVDALFAWTLWRAGGRAMTGGMALWLAAFPALGALWLTRLDLVPSVLAGCALLALSRTRHGAAGVLAAAGTAFKFWPAVALPGLLLPGGRPERLRVLAGFLVCAVVVLLATLAAAGSDRAWSPVSMQGERGLQIESFAALPLLWLRFLASDSAWLVEKSQFCNCHEIYGPGVAATIRLATLALLAASGALVVLYLRAFRAPPRGRTPAVAALLAALGVMAWIVTAKVFSPQYMIWLAGLLAALGALDRALVDIRMLWLFTVACLFTHLGFPYSYEALVTEHHFLQALALVVLTARDALVVVLGVRLAHNAWRATSPGPQVPRFE